MDTSSAFGTLDSLPSHLRFMIWQNLGPQRSAAMCTNSLVYEEIHAFKYDSLQINVQTDETLLVSNIAFSNHDHSLRFAELQCSDLAQWIMKIPFTKVKCLNFNIYPPSLDDPEQLVTKIPFTKIKCLTFNIYPPSLDDPGQLVRAWFLINHIIDAIPRYSTNRSSTNLPPVEVHIMQNADRRWSVDGILNRSDALNDFTDLESALLPFLRFHQLTKTSVYLPDDLQSHDPQLVERLATLVSDIGGNAPPAYASYMQHLRHIQLERLLDDLPGPTASVLRRERFALWSQEYEVNYHRHILDRFLACRDPKTRWRTLSLDGRSDSNYRPYRDDFVKLYLEMRAWNPMSIDLYEKPASANDEEAWHLYRAMKAQRETALETGGVHDGWSVREWRARYPHGLPTRSSTEYKRYVQAYAEPNMGGVLLDRRGILLEYDEDEIAPDLGGWNSCDGRLELSPRSGREWARL